MKIYFSNFYWFHEYFKMLRECCMNCKCSVIVQQGSVVWTFLVQYIFRDLWNICYNLGFTGFFKIGTLLGLQMLLTCRRSFEVITLLLQETDFKKLNVFLTLSLTSLSHNSLAVSRLSFPHVFHHHVYLEISFIHHVYLEISWLVMQSFLIPFIGSCVVVSSLLSLTFNFLNFVLDWHLIFCCELDCLPFT